MGSTAIDAPPIVDALWRRLRDVILAERRLERFAFAPEETGEEAGEEAGRSARERLAALAADPRAREEVARELVLRALAAAADGVNYRVLAALGTEPPVRLGELAGRAGLPALALAERLGALSQAGLARRDLERDGAEATEAGRGLVALTQALIEGLEDRLRQDLPALLGP